ncbi:MAG TPA: GAF domain-containing SpoIIE family protein phosphatase [Terriglobales bacterium]|nr:GAF domain-containing SpoIIE family protein phosphatase [Terriglobales bacterium]
MNPHGTATAAKELSVAEQHLAACRQFAAGLAACGTREQLLAQVPGSFVADLNAARSELWLPGADGTLQLAHSSGSSGLEPELWPALRQAAEHRKVIANTSLRDLGKFAADFAHHTGCAYLSALPLIAAGRLAGVIANYTAAPASEPLLATWRATADIAALAVASAVQSALDKKSITQLSLLFDATKLLNSTLDLAELLELILKIAKTETRADRASVFLVDKKRQQLWSIVAFGLDRQEIRLPLGRGVAGNVAASGELVNVSDAYTLEFFDATTDQRTGYVTKSLLCLPIKHYTGDVVGVIQLLNQTSRGFFNDEDVDFLSKLSGHMAMALENARLHREALEKQRLERELEMARGIQRGLLPDAPPVVPGYELAVSNQPCYEVGGDYYDFLSLGPQTLLLVIADVEGKGVSSALVMSNLQATLRALVMHLHSLEVLTLSLNEMIFNDTKSKKFLSIFLGLVDTRRNGLHYINAGHVPPILVDGKTGKYALLQEGGTVIGLFPEAEYTRGSVKLSPGDVLVACTDGVTEPCDLNEDEYGTERLAACVAEHRHEPAEAIIEAVLEDVRTFSAGGVHVDDQVLMILKVASDGSLDSAKGAVIKH